MSNFAFQVRVYYQDTDAGGVVYHGSYLNFAERARTEALRNLGLPYSAMIAAHGAMFVVRRLALDYRRPARLDDALDIFTRIVEVGGASAKLRQDFRRDSDSLAVLDVTLVCVRLADGRAMKIPAPWRGQMLAVADASGREVHRMRDDD